MKFFRIILLFAACAGLQTAAFAQTTVPLVNPQQLQIPATGVDLNNLINQINSTLANFSRSGTPPLTETLGITASVASPPTLVNVYNQVTTCPVGAAVTLSQPTLFASLVVITNATNNILFVNPPTGSQINTAGVNAQITIGAGGTVEFYIISTTQIYTVPTT